MITSALQLFCKFSARGKNTVFAMESSLTYVRLCSFPFSKCNGHLFYKPKMQGLLIVSLEKSHSEFDPKFIVFNLCRNRLFRLFMLWYFRRVQIMVKELLIDRHGAISLWRDQTWMFLNYKTFLSWAYR